MTDYITIADFAERAGVTKQAIYLRLNKDLNAYLKTFQGKKYLHTNGLSLFNSEHVEQVESRIETETIKGQANQSSAEFLDILNKHLTKTLELLAVEQEKNHKLQDELSASHAKGLSLAAQAQTLQGHMQQQTLGMSSKALETSVETNEQGIKGGERIAPKKNWFARMFK